ncbi:ribonuclease Y [Candidatus Sumerlaeota bacterium]
MPNDMMTLALQIAVLVVAVSISTIVGYITGQKRLRIRLEGLVAKSEKDAEKIVEDAKQEADELRKRAELESKDETIRKQKQLERELSHRRSEVERLERKLQNRESQLDKKLEHQDRLERSLADKHRNCDRKLEVLEEREADIAQRMKDIESRYEEISGLTRDQAKQELMASLETEVRQDSAALVRRLEQETKDLADKKARQIITLAIQRSSSDQVSESTVSVVPLANDEMKGRIIGREGRNIRALEMASGCNFIVDDTPGAVVLSCFDPIRRETARLSLEKLISDGRIHPGRIEEVVAKARKEVNNEIQQAGETTAFDLGVHDLHPELLKYLGRLKYRTSYGQNVLQHVVEVAQLAAIMASEIGGDQVLAKRAALLHDIGKAVSFEQEGPHALVGAELVRKYNETPAVVHAVAAHHNEEDPRTIIAVLVQAADAVSAARPGARRETLESYVKRLQKLEEIAGSFKGVEKSYAIQAGREVRIMVKPEELGENECALLARDVTKKIEGELQYPGQIKVTIIRETRVVDYAK